MMGRIHRPSGQGARLPELTLRQQPYPLGLALRCLALLAFTCGMGLIVWLFCTERLKGWETREYVMAVGGALLAAGSGGALWALERRIPAKWLLAGVLAVCAAIRLVYILVIPTVPETDFALLYQAARDSAQGDFRWSRVSGGYFYKWAYQIPYVLYEAAVIKVIPSMFALKVLNVIWMTGTAFLVYRIARRVTPEWAALYAVFLYAVFPGTFMLSSVLTNQHISMFFLLLGIDLVVSRPGLWGRLLGGVVLGVGNLMRPEGVIAVLAICCCGVLFLLENPGRKNAASAAAMLGMVLLGYFGVQKAAEGLLYVLNIAPHGIGNHYPQWKFLLGLDTTTEYGHYSDQDFSAYLVDDSSRWRLLREYIAQRFSSCEDLPLFFRNKVSAFWTQPDSFAWSMNTLESTDAVLPGVTVEGFQRIVGHVQQGMLLMMYVLTLPAAAVLWKRNRSGRLEDLLMLVILCGIFCVYLLVEVQVRYRYIIVPFLCLLDGVVMGGLFRGRKRETE